MRGGEITGPDLEQPYGSDTLDLRIGIRWTSVKRVCLRSNVEGAVPPRLVKVESGDFR